MKIKYDPEVDMIRITLKDVEIEETPGIILDFDSDRNIVGIEILNALIIHKPLNTRLAIQRSRPSPYRHHHPSQSY